MHFILCSAKTEKASASFASFLMYAEHNTNNLQLAVVKIAFLIKVSIKTGKDVCIYLLKRFVERRLSCLFVCLN